MGVNFREGRFKIGVLSKAYNKQFTSVAHHQANGQVEVINRILIQGIKMKLVQAGGQWVDAFLGALWSYRTNPCSTTGETPFNLVYGSKADIPTEAGLKTFRIQRYK
ncbi:UNVERIFIED_CONTAM: hypothetical protein Sradi_3984000 [Sesamum radiatum]|uniref:Integrase catalytic domain-containing protein n=1 Tax=Sesamum radiatum TaxID=300843 RepID=A0AAW2PLU7_SESRA